MAKKLCELCGEHPATVPDRARMGRLVNRVCARCRVAPLALNLSDGLGPVAPKREEL